MRPLLPEATPFQPLTRRVTGDANGGEGRIRTSEATRATDLQSVAFDRSATSPRCSRKVSAEEGRLDEPRCT